MSLGNGSSVGWKSVELHEKRVQQTENPFRVDNPKTLKAIYSV
jgi:hypothetical protein